MRLSVLPSGGAGRLYACDPSGHFVHVLSHCGQPLFSFGGFGAQPGRFNDPSDVVVISTGLPPNVGRADAALVAVADRGNDRVQIFEPDGLLIAVLTAKGYLDDWSSGSDVPLAAVRVQVPHLVRPSSLAWSAPFLDITTSDRRVVRVDLGVALLRTLRDDRPEAVSPLSWNVEVADLLEQFSQSRGGELTQYFTRYASFRRTMPDGQFWTRQ